MRHEFQVTFERDAESDRPFAVQNFPDKKGTPQLTAQLCAELDQNPRLCGTYAKPRATRDGCRFTIKFRFNHAGKRAAALPAFRKVLQRTYDRWHMAGLFNIHD